jgi:hypothetical protein
MLSTFPLLVGVVGLIQFGRSGAQTTSASSSGGCPTVLTPAYPAPVVGSGYIAQLVVTGLNSPRGLLIDSRGALLVVQQGEGIIHISFTDNGGTCLFVNRTADLIQDSSVSASSTFLTGRKLTRAL